MTSNLNLFVKLFLEQSAEVSSPASPETSTVTPSSTSPTTSASSVSLNDELDRLQSSLDPWARLQEDDESDNNNKNNNNNNNNNNASQATTTPEPTTTTTKISLFKIRTYVSAKTTTTTTFKPKSLADLVSFYSLAKMLRQPLLFLLFSLIGQFLFIRKID